MLVDRKGEFWLSPVTFGEFRVSFPDDYRKFRVEFLATVTIGVLTQSGHFWRVPSDFTGRCSGLIEYILKVDLGEFSILL